MLGRTDRVAACDPFYRKLTLDDEIRPQNTHGRHTDTRLGSSIGGAEASEHDGARAAHRAEERL